MRQDGVLALLFSLSLILCEKGDKLGTSPCLTLLAEATLERLMKVLTEPNVMQKRKEEKIALEPPK